MSLFRSLTLPEVPKSDPIAMLVGGGIAMAAAAGAFEGWTAEDVATFGGGALSFAAGARWLWNGWLAERSRKESPP